MMYAADGGAGFERHTPKGADEITWLQRQSGSSEILGEEELPAKNDGRRPLAQHKNEAWSVRRERP